MFLIICSAFNQADLAATNASGKTTQFVLRIPPYLIITVHYLIAGFFCIPLFFQQCDFAYDNGVLTVLLTNVNMPANAVQAGIVTTISSVICGICYAIIFAYLTRNEIDKRSRERISIDLKLALHGFLLFFTFSFMSAYFFVTSCYYFGFWFISEDIRKSMRDYYNIFSAILSFLSPYMIIFSNSMIRKKLFCKKKKIFYSTNVTRIISLTC